MRKTLGAAIAGLTLVAGGAMIAGSASAQPYYGYYYNPPPTTYYYTPPVNPYVAPAPAYATPYYSAPGLAGAVIGTILGADSFATVPGVPVDRFGPDPNGMLAADGHRIKCKLRSGYDDDGDAYMTRRVCWEEY